MVRIRTTLLLLLLCSNSLYAQNITMSDKLDEEKTARFKQDVRQITSFLEFLLNSLGDPESSASQKNTIINETYAKIFRDNKVQIEDDLLAKRDVVTNKDVQAYLKDIGFFFKGASFTLDVQEVEYMINQNGEHSFKVTMNRTLRALTPQGDSVLNIGPRFMEVILNPHSEDIKIVSLYSSLIDEENEMRSWWNSLPESLKNLTAKEISFSTSLTLADLRKKHPSLLIGDTLTVDTGKIIINNKLIYYSIRNLLVITELNCADITDIVDLSGVSKFKNLRRLDLQGTSIVDISPLAALENLESINISDTEVSNPDPLRLLVNLRSIDISNTNISNAYFLKNHDDLKKLNVSQTKIDRSDYFMNLEKLQELDISYTQISHLGGLKSLKSLRILNIDGMEVSDVSALKDLNQLEVLHANKTTINNLTPLKSLKNLKKIYCDASGIAKEQATRFMREKPGTLVVYDSQLLIDWWSNLDSSWKKIFSSIELKSALPSKDALQELTLINGLNLSGHIEITELNSLSVFFDLKKLDVSNCGIVNAKGLENLPTLNFLDLSSNPISDITVLGKLRKLAHLNLQKTGINNIDALAGLDELSWLNVSNTALNRFSNLDSLTKLKLVYCDDIAIPPYRIKAAVSVYPNVLFIYNSKFLFQWWSDLPADWKVVFKKHIPVSQEPKTEELHKLTGLDSIHINGNRSMTTLEPLSSFIAIRYLYFSNTGISSLDPIKFHSHLRQLLMPENPVSSLEALKDLIRLEELDLSGTPISDLRDMEFFIYLKKLNCSGTQIRNLKYLKNLDLLEHLEIQNSSIASLSPVNSNAPLKKLVCYNTRLSSRKVETFKALFPDCQVVFY